MVVKEKLRQIKGLLKGMESVLIAYSGGVDSTLLVKLAQDVLGERVMAVTAQSPLYPALELESAKIIAQQIGVRHLIIQSDELELPSFTQNPRNRCYLCKRELFGKLSQIAKQEGLNYILDGSNADDRADYRPGRKAVKEFGVRSILEEVGLSKDEVRQISKSLNLPTHNKPPAACLASRFPYHSQISRQALRMIEQAEAYIQGLSISQVRVRHYESLCRIEVDKSEMHILLENQEAVVTKLKQLGYTYITLDMEGYRTGSMNLL